MKTLLYDLQFGWRRLRKNPGFSFVAVLVLAMGIGANTAVFSVVNGLMLRPLYGQRAGELVGCYSQEKKNRGLYRAFSYPNYLDVCR